MQSNTSGGNVYDGLNIANNVIHILNAQSANPQVTLGIWENGHAHTSNITITNNSFLNDAAGNSPSLNLERAFRVTSHSGATHHRHVQRKHGQRREHRLPVAGRIELHRQPARA